MGPPVFHSCDLGRAPSSEGKIIDGRCADLFLYIPLEAGQGSHILLAEGPQDEGRGQLVECRQIHKEMSSRRTNVPPSFGVNV